MSARRLVVALLVVAIAATALALTGCGARRAMLNEARQKVAAAANGPYSTTQPAPAASTRQQPATAGSAQAAAGAGATTDRAALDAELSAIERDLKGADLPGDTDFDQAAPLAK